LGVLFYSDFSAILSCWIIVGSGFYANSDAAVFGSYSRIFGKPKQLDYMNYWLMKSEPDVYSIADLKQDKFSIWDGVRNYQARNFMREMSLGDLVFFYHSNTKIPGIVGLMRVIEANIADPTQFDVNSDYYDAKSTFDAPRWQTVKVEFVEEFARLISLEELKQEFSVDEILVVRKGNRLSVMPISEGAAERVLKIIENNPVVEFLDNGNYQ
jgi:predicted RNA-binding protein with PUA-like domain